MRKKVSDVCPWRAFKTSLCVFMPPSVCVHVCVCVQVFWITQCYRTRSSAPARLQHGPSAQHWRESMVRRGVVEQVGGGREAERIQHRRAKQWVLVLYQQQQQQLFWRGTPAWLQHGHVERRYEHTSAGADGAAESRGRLAATCQEWGGARLCDTERKGSKAAHQSQAQCRKERQCRGGGKGAATSHRGACCGEAED